MLQSNVVFALAKVLIATAWSDGKITQEENHSLKDLLFRLPTITGREWANLEMYMETPITAEERGRLIEELQNAITSPEEKGLVLKTLQEMVEADGHFSDEERIVVGEVNKALEEKGTSTFENIGIFLKGLMGKRSEKLSDAPNRERYFEDFIKNKIYYTVQQKLKAGGRNLDIPEENLKKLCLAGGMMARIALVDEIVTKEESAAIVTAFKKHWHVDEETAQFLAEVSLSKSCETLDYYRLIRDFFAMTTEDERIQYIHILFDVARSDGEASYEETEEIRTISKNLKLNRNQFILAKTK